MISNELLGFRSRSTILRPRALRAPAAFRLDEQLEVFPPVVVSDLLAGLGCPLRAQHHLAVHQHALCVGPTGVVGVAADVAAGRSVHGPTAVDLEHVAGAALDLARPRLRRGNPGTGIFDDERTLGDRRGGEQAKPGRRAADAVGFARGSHGNRQRQVLTWGEYGERSWTIVSRRRRRP